MSGWPGGSLDMPDGILELLVQIFVGVVFLAVVAFVVGEVMSYIDGGGFSVDLDPALQGLLLPAGLIAAALLVLHYLDDF
jgi:hypothetical protein